MSSLYSDPPFPRGSTLLSGEDVEYIEKGATYATGTPISGREIVGQVKAFSDIHPVTKSRLSNELVYCIAARFKPASATTVLNSGNTGADKGKAVVLRVASGMGSTAEFTDTLANAADVLAGRRVGFLDEYLNAEVRANDIVWIVVKGPVAIAKTTGAGINAGNLVSLQGSAVTTGLSISKTTQTIALETTATSERVAMGFATGSVNTSTNEIVTGANAASADTFVRTRIYGINWVE
jgi:hypothetical protein